MKKTYETPILNISGSIVSATRSLVGAPETEQGNGPGQAVGSVGFNL